MKSILVIDSGSTKTDWAYISGDVTQVFTTQGINPSADVHMPDLMAESSELYSKRDQISAIHYYGAGVIDYYTEKIVSDWLKSIFTQANIHVKSDLIGACKATANNSSGIISILGTGSNSCLYDGVTIIDNIPALGYTLSNEGGGSHIGKRILKSYFYRQMPENVKIEFEQLYKIDKSSVVNSLYKKDNPTGYLATYAQFMNQTKDKAWSNSILTEIFQEFIDIRIKSYPEYASYDLYFVGSIAFYYQEAIKEILEYNDLRAKLIIRKPIDGLVAYHKRD